MHFSIWPKLQKMIHFHANLFNVDRLKYCDSMLLPLDITLFWPVDKIAIRQN